MLCDMQSITELSYPGLPPSSMEAARYGATAFEMGRASKMDPVAAISYGSDPGQRLHIYTPRGSKRGLPVVLFFHGGAWVSGGLSWLRFMAPAVTALPAIFVAGSYRLAPDWRWPAAYEDVCNALALTQERIGEWGGDAARIVIGGHSAGGHLASLAVLRERSPQVAACFPVSCSFDLRYGSVPDDSPEGRVYKYLFQHRDQDAEASPVLYADGNRVPFHIAWGERDFERITRTSADMVRTLQSRGAPVTHEIFAGSGHFDTHLALAEASHPWYARLKQEVGHG